MTRTLVVLAGGRSTRFGGTDKALAAVAGRPMLARVLDGLTPVVDDVVVNCRADQRRSLGTALGGTRGRFAVDAVPDGGPVGGIQTGLAAAQDGWALVVGCDMPLFDPHTARDLFRRADAADPWVDAVVPVADGRRQPLGALYRVDRARIACELVGTNGRLREVLDALDTRTVESSVTPFRSVDTPEAAAAVGRDLVDTAPTHRR